MKLSIIIPVFNAQEFLQRCLQSVCEQNLDKKDYEVIIVNDGSIDESERIIKSYASNYQNIVYIKQTNKGVSAARNEGLNVAKGTYVTFVDADDAIEVDSLKKIINKLTADNLDIFYPMIENFDENGVKIGVIPFDSAIDIIKRGLLQERRTLPPTFYRASLVAGQRFNENISLGEDTVFNAKLQALAARVSYCDIRYYKYYFRKNSLSTKGGSSKAYTGFLEGLRDVRKFQQKSFSNNNDAIKYFDKIYEIFVTRIIELNIIPIWDRGRYDELSAVLQGLNLNYILQSFSKKYLFIDTSFYLFKYYQKYLLLKSKLHKFITRA